MAISKFAHARKRKLTPREAEGERGRERESVIPRLKAVWTLGLCNRFFVPFTFKPIGKAKAIVVDIGYCETDFSSL